MIKEIKEKFPLWAKDTETKFELILSDDIDSLMCAEFIKFKNKHNSIEYFFDANMPNFKQGLYFSDNATGKKRNILGLDISLEGNIKTWDNHSLKISGSDTYNTESANLNIALDINRTNFGHHAIVSSFITMLSYYNVNISKWNNLQKAILCCIDGLYTPFENSSFKETGKHNLELLEYGYLADFIEENLNIIKEVEKECNLKKGKIWVDKEGYLQTNIRLDKVSEYFGIPIELPKVNFNLKATLRKQYFKTDKYYGYYNGTKVTSKEQLYKLYNKKPFNFALTYAGMGVFSYSD